jgi:P2-related tail formation protein
MSRYDLLPPNATQLERDLSRATSYLQRIGRPVPTIRTAKRVNIPDGVVPWLVYEYGLGELLPYLSDQRLAIAEGVQWQRIRGTPAALKIALSWLGLIGTLEESEAGTYRWAEYQLGLAEATQGDDAINDVVGVCRISSPVRSRLQRIYAVYDFRRFVLDDSLLSDGGMLSDHSGVRPRPDWPQISYGQVASSLVQQDATATSTHTDQVSMLVRNFDRFLLDHSLLSEEWHTINHPSLLTMQEGVGAKYEGQTWGAFTWQPAPWGEVNAVASSSVTWELHPDVAIFIPGIGAVAIGDS